jgi:hypothetical protein
VHEVIAGRIGAAGALQLERRDGAPARCEQISTVVKAALEELGLSAHVSIAEAENESGIASRSPRRC